MDLTKINLVGLVESTFKPQLKIKDMKIGHLYLVQNISVATTKYGKSVVVETEDNSIFLPKRMSDTLDSKTIENMNCSQLALVFRGLKPTGHINPAGMVEFIKL